MNKVSPLCTTAVRLPTDEYIEMRKRLLPLHISFSAWVRTKMHEELSQKNN